MSRAAVCSAMDRNFPAMYRQKGIYTGKILRFFADRAAKKWPRRGSLKLG